MGTGYYIVHMCLVHAGHYIAGRVAGYGVTINIGTVVRTRNNIAGEMCRMNARYKVSGAMAGPAGWAGTYGHNACSDQ